MNYHAPTKQFTIQTDKLELAAINFLYAIKHIRDHAGLPLTPYDKNEHETNDAFWAQKAVIDGAIALGIDLGSIKPADIDVSRLR